MNERQELLRRLHAGLMVVDERKWTAHMSTVVLPSMTRALEGLSRSFDTLTASVRGLTAAWREGRR